MNDAMVIIFVVIPFACIVLFLVSMLVKVVIEMFKSDW